MSLLRSGLISLARRPLFAISLILVIVLGGREIFDHPDAQALHSEESTITAVVAATSTVSAVRTATALVVQPVTDSSGLGDREVPPADYPLGPWTLGWSYDCGSGAPKPSFDLEIYNALDSSFQHGFVVTKGRLPRGAGLRYLTLKARPGQQFVILQSGPCSWHVRAMRGHHRFAVSPAVPGHS